jgi:hypothetical protein
MEQESSSYSDWILESSSQDKLASCGKHTQITLYSNNNVQLTRFYCHRWDCENCSAKKREIIVKEIMDVSKWWWKIDLKGRSYQAVQKQIKRAGAEYIALGTGADTTIFVNKKLDDTEIVAFQKLADLIEEILKQPSEYRQRRFKHSRGLFQTEKKPESNVHLEMEAIINESVKKLIEIFRSKGYSFSTGFTGYHADLGHDARSKLEEILDGIKSKIEYKKEYKKPDIEADE